MENRLHELRDLFAQLGLPNEERDIRKFITEHAISEEIRLPDAVFWTAQQADFLREAWKADADWASVIDQLNINLHHNSPEARQNQEARA